MNQLVDVKLRGVLHGIAAALPVMQRQGTGQAISMGSIGAYTIGPTAAVYCATKFAVAAISEGLRPEVGGDICLPVVSPSVIESEPAESISDSAGREEMRSFRKIAMKPEAVARAIAFAIEQAAEVDVREIIVRPTASPY